MKIWKSEYSLKPKYSSKYLGPIRSKVRLGCLLKFEFEPGFVGYADLCPHPSYDEALGEYLQELSGFARNPSGRLAPILKQAIHCANMDAHARKNNESLYSDTEILNHKLIGDICEIQHGSFSDFISQGYRFFKIKLGSNLVEETNGIRRMLQWLKPDCKLRLDFNTHLSKAQFLEWLKSELPVLKGHLDFIEDPFVYDAKEWARIQEEYSIRFALDFMIEKADKNVAGAKVLVLKPAVDDVQSILDRVTDFEKEFVFTNYLDSGLGQMFALATAQDVVKNSGRKILTCGLQLSDYYQAVPLQDEIIYKGPKIIAQSSGGLGFSRQLEGMDWALIK